MLKKWVFFLGILACGCASVPTEQRAANRPHLRPNQLVYVAQAQSAYAAENATVQKMFVHAISSYSGRVFQSKGSLPSSSLPQVAEVLGSGYIFYVNVEQWEDHNTPWTTLRDKVAMRVVIVDVDAQKIVLDEQLKGVSKLWVARNEKPDVVAQDLIVNLVGELFE